MTVSSHIIKTLEDRGWIESIGHRDVPGRPALYATNPQFLDDLGLRSLDQLPAIEGDGSPESVAQGVIQFSTALDAALTAGEQPNQPLPDTEDAELPVSSSTQ